MKQRILAENLEQAFAAFKSQPPEAVLLDLQLGSENGLSLAAWIRKEPTSPVTPVIAVTTHAMVTDLLGLHPGLVHAVDLHLKLPCLPRFAHRSRRELSPG